MSTRLIKLKDAEGTNGYSNFRPELWQVLSEDLRDEEFRGTYEQCVKFLQNQCPVGGNCE